MKYVAIILGSVLFAVISCEIGLMFEPDVCYPLAGMLALGWSFPISLLVFVIVSGEAEPKPEGCAVEDPAPKGSWGSAMERVMVTFAFTGGIYIISGIVYCLCMNGGMLMEYAPTGEIVNVRQWGEMGDPSHWAQSRADRVWHEKIFFAISPFMEWLPE